MKVLVIEDDPILSQNIIDALTVEGITTFQALDGFVAEKMLKKEIYDCIVMDVHLPGQSGLELCHYFRQWNTETPVLMLTAFSDLEDKIKGFDAGADDYLSKPFYMRELLLRIQSLVKRSQFNTQVSTLTADDIVIQVKQKKVFRQGKEIILTAREYQILFKLVENQGNIISKQELIREIWGNIVDANTNTIEVYINFLRNKVDKPFQKSNIKTKIGYGYYFEPSDAVTK